MIGVVVPSNRPVELLAWQNAWLPLIEAAGARLYLVRDEPTTWAEIRDRLGDDAWIIPRRTDAIRAYGFLRAAWDGCDRILTLDDDCLPAGQTVAQLVAPLDRIWLPDWADGDSWLSTLQGLPPRGLPQAFVAPTMIHMGFWQGVPDLDGITQLAHPGPTWPEVRFATPGRVPPPTYFPMSGMHLAFRVEALPALWFGLQGDHLWEERSWGVHRYGDIWAGLLAKTVADALGQAVSIGGTTVHHQRASDPATNAIREAPGRAIHEWLWRRFEALNLSTVTQETWADTTRAVAQGLDLPQTPYWTAWRQGIVRWTHLCEDPIP